MQKSISLSRVCLVVCIVALLSTAVLTSRFSGLLPIFAFLALLAIVPIARGRRTQKIVAAVILAIAFTAVWLASMAYFSERRHYEKIKQKHLQQQTSYDAQSNPHVTV
jgi:uncharacterized membrane protein (GlpM family)